MTGGTERVRLTVTDNGTGGDGPAQGPGTGLTGLTERLASAGGSLSAGAEARGGFAVTAELPVAEQRARAGGRGEGAAHSGARPGPLCRRPPSGPVTDETPAPVPSVSSSPRTRA